MFRGPSRGGRFIVLGCPRVNAVPVYDSVLPADALVTASAVPRREGRMMEAEKHPEIVREKVSRIGPGRLSCALIFDREPRIYEIQRFYALDHETPPLPTDFEIAGRVLRYECDEADEAQWRLAAEIFLVKAFRDPTRRRTTDTDARVKRGLR